MKVTNEYTTLENQFENFDKEYQLYMLNILLDFMTAYGKNSLTRQEVYAAIKILALQKQMEKPKVKVLRKVA